MKQKIINLLHLSYNQVERLYHYGHISAQVWEAYCRVWDWSAPHFGGVIGFAHDAYWKRHGSARYYARINRVRAAFDLGLITPTPATT